MQQLVSETMLIRYILQLQLALKFMENKDIQNQQRSKSMQED